MYKILEKCIIRILFSYIAVFVQMYLLLNIERQKCEGTVLTFDQFDATAAFNINGRDICSPLLRCPW